MPQIVSTLSTSMNYTGFHKSDLTGAKVGKPAHVEKVVHIKGGANMSMPVYNSQGIAIPSGVATHVSDADLDFLHSVPLFKTHMENGYIKIVNVKKDVDADKIAGDMTDRDQSAPLDESKGDFEKGGRAGGSGDRAGEVVPKKVDNKPSKK